MSPAKIAYFSAEIGIDSSIKTYSGGLGVLAGDTIKAMADLGVPACAVTLLYREGFFKQKIVHERQQEEADSWDYPSVLSDTGITCTVNISNEEITIKAWNYTYVGAGNKSVTIYFLDTNLDENSEWAKDLTRMLYQGDRLSQEIILGIGGVRMLEALGEDAIEKYHMNEGHSAFLTLELYKQLGEQIGWEDSLVKRRCVFTTHTPIPAGHDKFPYEEVFRKLEGEEKIIPWHIRKLAGEEELNMTQLAISFSDYHNAVSRKHLSVTEEMFPNHTFDYVTNGVHLATWVGPAMQEVFDHYIPEWRKDNEALSKVNTIPDEKLLTAHRKSKEALITMANERNVVEGSELKPELLTIGFARRFIQYKDAELVFKNLKKLRQLAHTVQFVFAGKSHAEDELGKDIMQRIIEYGEELSGDVTIAFIPDYDMEVTSKMIAGCDLWLNTPVPPNEASGTSGMKASVNGCLHFSRLDGWAIEGFERNGGGFPIYEYPDFMVTLQYKILPMFYDETLSSWSEEMKRSIMNVGSYFNTHRMVREYCKKAYRLK